MGLTDSISHLLIGFITGTIGIHLGAVSALGSSTWKMAATAALVGAAVWAVAGLFLGWIPLIGSLVIFFIWLAAIMQVYGTSWGSALDVALVAWVIAVVAVHVESWLGIRNVDAVGVPGA